MLQRKIRVMITGGDVRDESIDETGDKVVRRFKNTLVINANENGSPSNDIHVRYNGKRTPSAKADMFTIEIMNLAPKTRDLITSMAENKPTIRLEVGYVGSGLGTLYYGDIRMHSHGKAKPNVITTIESGDGLRALSGGYIDVSYPGEKKSSDIFKEVVNVFKEKGVSATSRVLNFVSLAATELIEGVPETLKDYRFKGSPIEVLNQITKQSGGHFKVQNGALDLVLTSDKASNIQESIVLNATSGLLSGPRSIDGGVEFDAVIMPSIQPGAIAEIDDELWVITNCSYSGDNRGGQSVTVCQAQKSKKVKIDELRGGFVLDSVAGGTA